MKRIFTLLFILPTIGAFAQKLETLTVEKITRDPKWIGTSPDNIHWGDDSKHLYFDWNPEGADRSSLYGITTSALKPEKISLEMRREMPSEGGTFNKKRTLKLYEKNGDIWLLNVSTGKASQLTSTTDRESNPVFSSDEKAILFIRAENLYAMDLNGAKLTQLTNFTHSAVSPIVSLITQGRRGGAGRGGNGNAAAAQASGNQQEKWLKEQQLELFDIVKQKDKDEKLDAAERKEMKEKTLKEIALGEHTISMQKLSPDGRFVSYRLMQRPADVKTTNVPNYVTASGFTEDIPNRTKVGAPQSTFESWIFDRERDTVYKIVTSDIPGIKDIPAYIKDYPKELEEYTKRNEDRKVAINGPFWSEDGKNAVVFVGSEDYKDRWLMKLDPLSGHLTLIDRQHDDAWIGGPGIGGSESAGNHGWIDNTHFYYQSEASGYSHIYVADVATGEKKQLTTGKWEVQTLELSNDKKTFYFTANMEHPGATAFYRMPVTGGTPVKITSMMGGNEVTMSPDEKWLAIRYSYTDKPWELYLQANKPGAKAEKITNSVSDEFKSYPWRAPQIITFKNRYGSDVYARVYEPKTPDPAKPAVVFVHGAGYLQNVTYSWSYYFHEFMFNNLLADNGYYVIDIDYTASAGYGRDWRTGIYRHMGGKDLSDQVDGVKYLVEKYGINPKHVGLYGGSYGGFITLMAMFTQPDVFAAGAGLRSVTDWAHYNHGYTAEILNEPFTDEKAYKQSSPIYFADGLKGRLLMCHGMIDQNVNYEDIVRVSQRLIELHKDNWELASYPVEDHGFEQPSSWADEYKRIYKLFEETLK